MCRQSGGGFFVFLELHLRSIFNAHVIDYLRRSPLYTRTSTQSDRGSMFPPQSRGLHRCRRPRRCTRPWRGGSMHRRSNCLASSHRARAERPALLLIGRIPAIIFSSSLFNPSSIHIFTFPSDQAAKFLAGHGFRLAGLDVALLAEDLQLVDVVRRLGDNLCRPIAHAGGLQCGADTGCCQSTNHS